MINALTAMQNVPTEWSYASSKSYADPFNEATLDVEITGPDRRSMRIPAFWAGENQWRVRFAADRAGEYRFRTLCSDEANRDLHDREGRIAVEPYTGENPLFRHGRLRITSNRRHLEHADGTPFFWLADTWWMGLSKRLGWPDDFQTLTADRKAKGFSVVQIVAGLYPDMAAFEERAANEAGHPWTSDYARINPAYFDHADLRLRWLIRCGIVPCIVGAWGYHLIWMGVEQMQRHCRNLVARYGAYPVVWCLAGEATMPFYRCENRDRDEQEQKRGWTQIARYVRELDPWSNPITIHPTTRGRDQVEDPAILDFEMLQTGHSGHESISPTVRLVREALDRQPTMPVIDSEVCYEGIMERCGPEVQRIIFWSAMLSGAAGHTYGANGIWQVNTEAQPYGPSPHGASWGGPPWNVAMNLRGSSQLAAGKRILEKFPWWSFERHPEWIEPTADQNDPLNPYAAGVPGKLRLIYFPRFIPSWAKLYTVRKLERGIHYRAAFINPLDATEIPLGPIAPDGDGSWPVPHAPVLHDWLLALEAE